jgi:GntR family transcriptional regulator
MKKISDETLHERAEKAIIEHYLNSDQNRLEPEEVLAEMLGVSRITVREAMNSLVRKGCLTKRKGKGNFIHKSVLNAKMRIDQIADFSRQLEQIGYSPTLAITFIEKSRPEPEIGELLGCAEGELVLNFLLHFMADDQSAIRLYLQTPDRYFRSVPPDQSLQGEALYASNFYKENCNLDISHYISYIEAVHNPEINRAFGLDEGLPLVALKQYNYDLLDHCIGYAQIYLNPKISRLSVVSKYE